MRLQLKCVGKVHINSLTLESYISILLQENTSIVGKELFDSDYHSIPFLNDV